jgi:hypothetical protein
MDLPSEPEQETRGALQAACTSFMDVYVDEDQWDQAPNVMILARTSHGVLGAPLDVYEWMWQLGRVPYVIDAFATAASTPEAPLPRLFLPAESTIIGLVLHTESWAMRAPEDSTEQERAAAFDYCHRHSIADHPWGRESRTVSGVDIYGQHVVVQHMRGDDEVLTIGADSEMTVSGAVDEALTRLLAAITARTEPWYRPMEAKVELGLAEVIDKVTDGM